MDTSLLPLAYLLPAGLLLIAWSSGPAERLRESALAAGVMVAVSVVAYFSFGFALQFGGIGLSPISPAGLLGLDRAWTPFHSAVGRWSLIGLEGFFVNTDGSPAGLALVELLVAHRLPMAIAAGLIPILALGTRVNRVALIASGIVSTAFVFPVVGAWIWGGGWLAMTGVNLNFGHGAIDPAGSGVVFLAAGSVAWIALWLFGQRDQAQSADLSIPPQPALAFVGAILLGAGWSAWTMSDPLLSPYRDTDFVGVSGIGLISAAASTVVVVLYFWLASGRIHPTEAARGWAAGWIAVSASAMFISPTSAILIGIIAGGMLIGGQHLVEKVGRLPDRAGHVAMCSMAGAWGLIALGLFADGTFGAGWHGVTASVRGLLASDPGQFTAQLAAAAAIATYAICVSTILLSPLSLITRRSIR